MREEEGVERSNHRESQRWRDVIYVDLLRINTDYYTSRIQSDQ